MKANTPIKASYFAMMLFIFIAIVACEKDVASYVPGDGKECYVNFYNASEAIVQSGNQELFKQNMIYINDSLNSSFYTAPKFSENGGALVDGRQFPMSYTGNSYYSTINWSGGTGYLNDVYWQSLDYADYYRFVFTSVNKTFLKDISVFLKPKTFTSFYLTESPEADDAYIIVPVPVELEGTEGKVKVQVVNLATDWGAIEVMLAGKDGNPTESGLPMNLEFGQYSPYVDLDVTQATEKKQLVIKVRKKGESDFALSTAIDAVPGSGYSIVIKGFANETVRYIKKNNTEKARVEVMPSLRIHNRRIY